MARPRQTATTAMPTGGPGSLLASVSGQPVGNDHSKFAAKGGRDQGQRSLIRHDHWPYLVALPFSTVEPR